MPALSRIALSNIKKKISQWEATTGRKITPDVIKGLAEAEISEGAKRGLQERALGLEEKRFKATLGLERERLETTKRAAKISGIVDLAELGLTATQALKDTEVGAGLVKGAKAITSGVGSLFGGGTKAAEPAYIEAMGHGKPGGTGFLGSAAAGLGVSTAAEAIGLDRSKSMGTGAAIGTALFGFPFGTIGGALAGSELPETLAKGATEALKSSAELVGDVLEAPVKIISGVTGGTVICTELNKKGFMSDEVYKLDKLYGEQKISKEVYLGYRKWADFVVKKMQQFELVTFLIAPFGLACAFEMAHRVKPEEYKSNFLGRILLTLGIPVCKWLGRNK